MESWKGTSSPRKRIDVFAPVLLTAILGLTFILRMKFWGQPLEMDEGVYGYIGWRILDGVVPYKHVFDHKPPGVYLLYSLVFWLSKPTALNIKVFASIYTLGTVLAVFFVAKKVAGETAGLLSALLFAVFSSGPNIQGGGVNAEVFMVLPYTLAAISFMKAVETGEGKSYFFAGFWTGLASTIKQVAATNLLWFGTFLLIRLWRERKQHDLAPVLTDGLLLVTGVFVPWLPFVLYFYLHDALGNFYFWQVTFNFGYIGKGYGELPNAVIFLQGIKKVLSENGVLWLLALWGVWWWRSWRKTPVSSSESEPETWQRAAWFQMSVWPLFSFLGVAAGGRFFPHYYIQMIPSLAVLGGVGLQGLCHEIQVKGAGLARRPMALIFAAILFWALVLSVKTDAPYYLNYNGTQISLHQYRSPIFSISRFIGHYIRQRTQPDDLVYVWAVNPEINFYALRKTPSPYLVHRRELKVPAEEVIRALQRSPPKYIIVMEEMKRFPQLEDYIRGNYQEETEKELDQLKQLWPFYIYRRTEG
jgi:4-amino-4-deoxy-L-arabinose transferase-like glycosyltransferase